MITDMPQPPDYPTDLPGSIRLYVREWMHEPSFALLPLPRQPEDPAGYPEAVCAHWEPQLALWLIEWERYKAAFDAWHDETFYTPETWHELRLGELNRLIAKGYRFKHLASLMPFGQFPESRVHVVVTATPSMVNQRKQLVQDFARKFNIKLGNDDSDAEAFLKILREGRQE